MAGVRKRQSTRTGAAIGVPLAGLSWFTETGSPATIPR